MVGVPIEFENICEMMKYFKSNENINVKTQVIGLAVGKKDELFPKNREYLSTLITLLIYLLLQFQPTHKDAFGLNGLTMTPLVTMMGMKRSTQSIIKDWMKVSQVP